MKLILVGVVILLLSVGTWWYTQEDPAETAILSNSEAPVVATVASEADTRSDVTRSEENDSPMMESEREADVAIENSVVSGVYQTYSEDALAASTATHNVLIFSATWCPSCRALDTNIKQNISTIPGDVALFTIDYDTNVALRQQYGVTSQHTLVLVETDGTEIKKWLGGNTLGALLSNI